ncbi:MAG: MFS transporter [Dehalococcoidia bacterium]
MSEEQDAPPTPEPPGLPPRRPQDAARRAFDSAYSQADRIIDRGQRGVFRLIWVFLPEPEVARDLRFQQILASRFLSDAGQQALAYSALVAVVLAGGSAFDAALVGIAALVPAGLLGLYGGAVADALPRRIAMAMVYNFQALLCFIVPTFAGTDLAAIILLVFLVNVLGQVSGPTESAVLPVVASDAQLATATSLVHFGSSLGTGFGTVLLAPVLVHAFGVKVAFYVAGVLLLLAASRVFDLPGDTPKPLRGWRPPEVHVRDAIDWLLQRPAVAAIFAVSIVSGTANIVMQTLGPRYVQSALGIDATAAVYVFAPSAAGLLLALALGPMLMRVWGERIAALAGFALTGVALVLLGAIDGVSDTIEFVNPARLGELFGVGISDKVRTAGMIAALLGFGVSLTTTSVQTYINRRVPLAYQGRAFALQSTLKNGVAIVPLLTLGGAATAFGVEPVLIVSPLVLVALGYGLVLLSFRFAHRAPASRLEVLSSFWEEPEVAAEGRGGR